MWKPLVLVEVHADIQISNKEVTVKPKFAILNVKNKFSFSLCKYQPWYKYIYNCLRSFQIQIFQFVALLLSTFCGFSIFDTGFAFGFGNFAQYCVVLFTCLQWVTFPKKSWPIVIDVRKSWSIVIDTRRSHCPIDLRFQEVSNLLVGCELCANLYELKSRIWFLEEYNHFERVYRAYRFDRFLSNFA